mmetsp:Transcript_64322/g.199161  ORF Transcript_64322/g.199161 Transcript_64322/m.199161 type:complete len:325 (-) Transcript_64322:580-1554(-)
MQDCCGSSSTASVAARCSASQEGQLHTRSMLCGGSRRRPAGILPPCCAAACCTTAGGPSASKRSPSRKPRTSAVCRGWTSLPACQRQVCACCRPRRLQAAATSTRMFVVLRTGTCTSAPLGPRTRKCNTGSDTRPASCAAGARTYLETAVEVPAESAEGSAVLASSSSNGTPALGTTGLVRINPSAAAVLAPPSAPASPTAAIPSYATEASCSCAGRSCIGSNAAVSPMPLRSSPEALRWGSRQVRLQNPSGAPSTTNLPHPGLWQRGSFANSSSNARFAARTAACQTSAEVDVSGSPLSRLTKPAMKDVHADLPVISSRRSIS